MAQLSSISKIKLWTATIFLSSQLAAQPHPSLSIEKVIEIAEKKYRFFVDKYNDPSSELYSIRNDGTTATVGYKDWTSGFFPGCLWLLYEFTSDQTWKAEALKRTETLRPASLLTTKHDLGFILMSSFGKSYQLTKDTAAKTVLLTGARSLSSRFNPTVGSIRSWDNGPWHYPVIVDNLMNLELLFWAARETRDTCFLQIADSHLNNDLQFRFRNDGSTFHVLDFDPSTGKLLAKKTWQGFSDSSCWSRGQAWAIYGFTMAYRYTHNHAYLQGAQKAAGYFLKAVKDISDRIPYWDFNDPDIPNTERDASAAAVAASALLELSQYDPRRKNQYVSTATQLLKSLCSDAYLDTTGSNNNYFLLKHSVVNKPGSKGIDVPVMYADYYFLEALWRYKHNLISEKKH